MRLVQTLISGTGFRDSASNSARIALLGDVMTLAVRARVDLLVLPAGVLAANGEGDLDDRISDITELARRTNLSIVGGADVDGGKKGRRTAKKGSDLDDLVSRGRLPYFGFVTHRGTPGPVVWRQTSTTNENASLVHPDAVPGVDRVVQIAGRDVGVLICGELFSRLAREQVAAAGPDLILDLGHSGMSQGLIPAMKSLARSANAPVVHAQHLSNWWGRQFHFVDANADQRSVGVDEADVISRDDIWGAWVLRTVS